MIQKRLERSFDFSDREDSSIPLSKFKLEYYLVESKIEERGELKGREVYGVEITKRMMDNAFESEVIKNISCCKHTAQNVLHKLADNTVTPVSLKEIIDDIV